MNARSPLWHVTDDPRLGKSGLKISKIILGAMSYGTRDWQDWVLNEDDALPLIEHAYKSGINTWDTVRYYCLLRRLRLFLTS